MPDEPFKNAPNVGKGFDKVKDAAPPKPEPKQEPAQGIATKDERDRLQARNKELNGKMAPQAAPSPSMDGAIKTEVDKKNLNKNEQERQANQKKIDDINKTLGKRNLSRDFDRSR